MKTVSISIKTEDEILRVARMIRAARAGRRVSDKKSISSAKNGRLGGRPRKHAA